MRLLGPAPFGVLALAFFFFSLLDVRSKIDPNFAFLHKQPTTPDLIATHLLFQLLLSLISLLIAFIAVPLLLAAGYKLNVLTVFLILSGLGLIDAAGSTARVSLEKEFHFARSMSVVSSALFLSHLTAIIMAWQGFGYWALVAREGVNTFLSTVGFWFVYKGSRIYQAFKLKFNKDIAKWMLKYGLALLIGSIATLISLQFDDFLVGTFAGTVILGYYAQAYKIATWPTGLVTHIVSRAAAPTYAKLQTDRARLTKAFELSLFAILTFAFPLGLAIFASAKDFVLLLFGAKWLPSVLLLRLLIFYSIFRTLLDDTGALYTAVGKPRYVSQVLVLEALMVILLATPLTYFYHAVGAAIAVGVAFFVGIAYDYYLIRQVVDLKLKATFWPYFLAAVLSVVVYFFFLQLINLAKLWILYRLLIKAGMVVFLFYLFLYLWQRQQLIDGFKYIWGLFRS
jgi:O-antigen/teichoic acid export membrane protein